MKRTVKFKKMGDEFSIREQVTEETNKLFVNTDNGQGKNLLDGGLTRPVLFDMSSSCGREPVIISAREVYDKWGKGFD